MAAWPQTFTLRKTPEKRAKLQLAVQLAARSIAICRKTPQFVRHRVG
jgi:hypothetical protein